MGASIKEVAVHAGVSASAVSLYLNSPNTKRVGLSAKRRIDKAVKDLHYRKNVFASSLSRDKSLIVGVIIPTLEPQFQNQYTATLLSGAQERLARSGYSILFFPSSGSSSTEIVKEQLEKSAGCDGYLLFSTGFCPMGDISGNIAELNRTGKPFVTLNVPEVDEDINQILIEDLGTARGVSYLMEHGHRDILLVLGRRNGEHARLILEDYRALLGKFDVPYDNDLVLYGNYDADAARNVVLRFLSLKRRITAVCCLSDAMALGASSAIRDSGFAIPADISVIGRNNSFFARHISPPLTTIDLQIQGAGATAADLLLENIDETQRIRKIRIAGSIVEGETVNELVTV